MNKIDKSTLAYGITPAYRDRKYLDRLREKKCFFTHHESNDVEGVDPAHVGIAGRGLKAPDYHCVPLLHSIHDLQTRHGWRQALMTQTPEAQEIILKDAFRCVGEVYFIRDLFDTENAAGYCAFLKRQKEVL